MSKGSYIYEYLVRALCGLFATVTLLGAASPVSLLAQSSVDYDIVYVRAPRYGDNISTSWPEVFDPTRMEPGAHLMLLHPDGSEEILVASDGKSSMMDPYVSFDGKWVYYSKLHDQSSAAWNGNHRASRAGADIYKVNIETRENVRLTFQEWTPSTGTANWVTNDLEPGKTSGEYSLPYGIYNTGPCPIPGGKIMFTSSRNGYLPNKGFTAPNLQLFVMDEDGANVELIGHLNLGSALHPTILKDGRVMFSSYEAQGIRDQRLWGLWAIWPDGRNWEPLISSYGGPDTTAFHFQTQLSNEHIGVIEYYNLNNNGFGTLLAFPPKAPDGELTFGNPNPSLNPPIKKPSAPQNSYTWMKYSFQRYGLYNLTEFSHPDDSASALDQNGIRMGKVTHPSGAPDNDLLIVWTPGPANDLNRPTSLPAYDGGLYLIKNGGPVSHPSQMIALKNDAAYNEMQPRAVVSYQRIYGVSEPHRFPWLPNKGALSNELPAGTPFGLVGTSTFYKRDTKPSIVINQGQPARISRQGGDIGTYADSDIHAVRILSMEPTVHRGAGPGIGNVRITGYKNWANERLRILGEIPLRKFDSNGNPILDVDGNPDTSFLAKIPADVPFTFQTIDKDGLALNISQTWHQLRPGEIRNDCGGCHSHNQKPTDFAVTEAAKPGYQIPDLTRTAILLTKNGSGGTVTKTQSKVLDVEWYRDIKPIIDRSCVSSCHTKNNPTPDAGLVLDDGNEYARLVGLTTNSSQVTKYVQPFGARLSLLTEKVYGRKLDGSGDPLIGTVMPPAGAGVPVLTEDEKMNIARWIDLGAPITEKDKPGIQYETKNWGWFMDAIRPTIALSAPRAGVNTPQLREIRVGLFDYYSGLDMSTLSVKADFAVNGKAAGSELAGDLAETADAVWTLQVNPPITDLQNGTLTVSIKDHQGNLNKIVRKFSVQTRPRPEKPSNLEANVL